MVRMVIPAALLVCLSFGCNNEKTTTTESQDKPTIEPTTFYGKMVVQASFVAGDSVLAATLSTFSPSQVDIYFAPDSFRLIEHGGLSNGNIILYPKLKEAWQLDTIKRLAYLGEYSDLGDPSAALKDLMPDHFAPTVESMQIQETIAGHICTKYRVLRSGIIPDKDTAYIWVAQDIVFPPARYDIQTEINQVAAPPTLLIGYAEGAVLRLEVKNPRYTRKFEVVELSPNAYPKDIFRIPTDYQKK